MALAVADGSHGHMPRQSYLDGSFIGNTDQVNQTNAFGSANTFDGLMVPDHQAYLSNEHFATFLDNLVLPDFPYFSGYQMQPVPLLSPENSYQTQSPQDYVPPTQNDGNVSGEDQGLSRYGSRLPSLEPDTGPAVERPSSASRSSPRFGRVRNEDRERMLYEMRDFGNVLPVKYSIPSRHALQRFVSAYLAVFHEHFPILHVPTLSMTTIHVELFLGVAALGAVYCREKDKALELYSLSKNIGLERLRRHNVRRSYLNGIQIEQQPLLPHPSLAVSNSVGDLQDSLLETAQALMMNIAIAMWSENTAQEALALRSPLAALIHQESVFKPLIQAENVTWLQWVRLESVRRTIAFIYAFFNLLTICFDIPPTTMYSELNTGLPSSDSIWRAETESKWRAFGPCPMPQDYQLAMSSLFNGLDSQTNSLPKLSSLGGYTLMHGIIQQIWILQKGLRIPMHSAATTLPLEQVTMFEHALRRWRHAFERGKERTIDPIHPSSRVAFNATALLRLAYIRINIDSSSVRALETWDPERSARSFLQSPSIIRSDKMTRAALHCAYGLSVPIKLGVSFVAHTQIFFWSNQHALCSLECAVLLTKWLEMVTLPQPIPPLRHDESKVLDFILQMVAETEYDAPREELLSTNYKLCAIVVRIWAQLFRPDSIWEMVELIGRSLRRYGDLLENLHNGSAS